MSIPFCGGFWCGAGCLSRMPPSHCKSQAFLAQEMTAITRRCSGTLSRIPGHPPTLTARRLPSIMRLTAFVARFVPANLMIAPLKGAGGSQAGMGRDGVGVAERWRFGGSAGRATAVEPRTTSSGRNRYSEFGEGGR